MAHMSQMHGNMAVLDNGPEKDQGRFSGAMPSKSDLSSSENGDQGVSITPCQRELSSRQRPGPTPTVQIDKVSRNIGQPSVATIPEGTFSGASPEFTPPKAIPRSKASPESRIKNDPAQPKDIALGSGIKYQRMLLLHLLGQLPVENESLQETSQMSGTQPSLSVAPGPQKFGKNDSMGTEPKTTEAPVFRTAPLPTAVFQNEECATVRLGVDGNAPGATSISTLISTSRPLNSSPCPENAPSNNDSALKVHATTNCHVGTSSQTTESLSNLGSGNALKFGSWPDRSRRRFFEPDLPPSALKITRSVIGDKPECLMNELPLSAVRSPTVPRGTKLSHPQTLFFNKEFCPGKKDKETPKTSPFVLPQESTNTLRKEVNLGEDAKTMSDGIRAQDMGEQTHSPRVDTQGIEAPSASTAEVTLAKPSPSSAEEASPLAGSVEVEQAVPESSVHEPSLHFSLSDLRTNTPGPDESTQDKSDVHTPSLATHQAQRQEADSTSDEEILQEMPETKTEINAETSRQVLSDLKSTLQESETCTAGSTKMDRLLISPEPRIHFLEAPLVSSSVATNSTVTAGSASMSSHQTAEMIAMSCSKELDQRNGASRSVSQVTFSTSGESPIFVVSGTSTPSIDADSNETTTSRGDSSWTPRTPGLEISTNPAIIGPFGNPCKAISPPASSLSAKDPVLPLEGIPIPGPQALSHQKEPSPFGFIDSISPPITYKFSLQTSHQHKPLTPPDSPGKQRHNRDISVTSMPSTRNVTTTDFWASSNVDDERPHSSISAKEFIPTRILRKPVPSSRGGDVAVEGHWEGKEVVIPRLSVSQNEADEHASETSATPLESTKRTQTLCAVCGHQQLFENWGCVCDGVLDGDDAQDEGRRKEDMGRASGSEKMNEEGPTDGVKRRLAGKELVSGLRRKLGRKVIAVGRKVSGEL